MLLLVEFPSFLLNVFLPICRQNICIPLMTYEHLYVTLSNKVTNTVFSLLQLPETSLLKLDSICRSANIVLVAARSYGLTGLVRVSIKVLHISNPKKYVKCLCAPNYHDDILSKLARPGSSIF
jgi:hypothetical protein